SGVGEAHAGQQRHRRRNCEHREHIWKDWLPTSNTLLRLQGGRRLSNQGSGPGSGRQRHPRECDTTGPRGHAHARKVTPGPGGHLCSVNRVEAQGEARGNVRDNRVRVQPEEQLPDRSCCRSHGWNLTRLRINRK
ncbi:unnamed protein product, partial [Ixodes pacificus]